MSSEPASEPYEPEVDDYVIWERETWARIEHDEGWVYFKAPIMEEKKGFRSNPRYITIETGVQDKHPDQLKDSPLHRKTHTLLLCYEHQWKELKFVKRRESPHIEHYSQYDERAGNWSES